MIDRSFFKGQDIIPPGKEAVFEFLWKAENISRMIHMTERGLPALIGVVQELESKYAEQADFSLAVPYNRQIIGRMVKNTLSYFGYAPLSKGQDRSVRLREFSKSAYFTTSAIYHRTDATPTFNIACEIQRYDLQTNGQ